MFGRDFATHSRRLPYREDISCFPGTAFFVDRNRFFPLNIYLNLSYCLENRFTDGSADGMISDERQKMVMHGLCCGGRRFPEDGKGKYI